MVRLCFLLFWDRLFACCIVMFTHIEILIYVLYYIGNQTMACYLTSFTQEGEVSVLNYFGNQNFCVVFAYHLLLFTVFTILEIMLSWELFCSYAFLCCLHRKFVCVVLLCFGVFWGVFFGGGLLLVFVLLFWCFGCYFWNQTFYMLSKFTQEGIVSVLCYFGNRAFCIYYLKLFT